MALASEILARAFEESNSCFPSLDNEELVRNFLEADKELGVLKLLRGLNTADQEVSSKKNVILMFSEKDELQVKSYRDASEALRSLFELERDNPGKDIVLVRAASATDVRIAFRNYFSDAGEFIRLVDEGCQSLANCFIEADPTPFLNLEH
jgi:putative GTP pyrophosphokinase